MAGKPVWSRILDDEALTRGLADPEARMLVEWLVEWVEHLEDLGQPEDEIADKADLLCRRMRGAARFVRLWCHDGARRAAVQLAGAERFGWELPTKRGVDPCEVMQTILTWEAEQQKYLAARKNVPVERPPSGRRVNATSGNTRRPEGDR